ncbi:MAG: Rieske 2Fe-2S domain-containing protein [Candidatus Kapabacteria bacterium]|nr:Rieske 2Fe-2S domain-containing protein [Candidatus Kapabacteria bacterium]
MENKQERREFLKKAIVLAGSSLCATCAPAFFSACEYIQEKPIPTMFDRVREHIVDLSLFPELSEIGGAISKSFGKPFAGRPVIIIRKAKETDDDFSVFSSICPHQGGEILLNDDKGKNHWCAEHYSEYEFFTGENLKPPDYEPDYKEPLVKLKYEYYPEENKLKFFY